MPAIQLQSTDFNLNVLTGETAQIIIATDSPFADPAPDSILIGLEIAGANPTEDIEVQDFGEFGWLYDVVDNVWRGSYTMPWAEFTPTQPLIFTVAANQLGLTGDRDFTIELYDPNAAPPGPFYVINPVTETYTITQNPTEIRLGPDKIGFDKRWVTTNQKAVGYGIITNETLVDITLDSLVVSGDADNITTLKWRDNVGGDWQYVASAGTPTILAGDYVHLGVEIFALVPTNTSGLTVDFTYEIGGSPRESKHPVDTGGGGGIIDPPGGGICAALNSVNVELLPFTWTDGSVYAGFADCSVLPGGVFTLPNQCECTIGPPPTPSVTFTFRLTNNMVGTCPDGGPGYVRMGQLSTFWSTLENDNLGTCVLVPPPMATDVDAKLFQGATIEFQVIYTCSTAISGPQEFKMRFVGQECGTPDDNFFPGDNDTVDMLGISTVTQLGVGGIDPNNFGISPIPIDYTGEGDTANLQTGAYDYNWVAETVNTYNQATGWFEAPDTATYSIRANWAFPRITPGLVVERKVAIFKNNAHETTIQEGTLFDTGEWNFNGPDLYNLTLNAGDTLAIGAWIQNGEKISDSFAITIAQLDTIAEEPVCEMCSPTLQWDTIDWDVDISPVSITFTDVPVGTTSTVPVTITNNGSDTFNITGITDNCDTPPITTTFVAPVAIAPGGNTTFDVECAPLAAGSQACLLSIATDGCEELSLPISWSAIVEPAPCTSAITSTPSAPLTITVTGTVAQSGFININTGNFSGALVITAVDTSGNNTFNFDSNWCGPGGLSYCETVADNTSYLIPYEVLAPCPPPTPYFVDFTATITNDGDVCTFTAPLEVNVDCIPVQTCPVTITPNAISVPTETPGSTGSLTITWRNNLIPLSDIGASEIVFYLPTNLGGYFSIPAQPVQPGITWGACGGTYPTDCIKATIDPALAGQDVYMQLDYVIPSTYVSPYTIINSLYVDNIFADPALHDCPSKQIPITIPVFDAVGSTGLEVGVAVAPADTDKPCDEIIITDTTVWGSEVTGHQRSDFNGYRTIKITGPKGLTYLMSTMSQEPLDEKISTAALGFMMYSYELHGDGLYEIRLCQVPGWDNLATYPVGSIVQSPNGTAPIPVFYKCKVLNFNKEPNVDVNWTNYWTVVAEEDLDAPYCATTHYLANCDLEKCYENLSQTIFCGINDPCAKDICDDDCWINYNKLMIIRDSIQVAYDNDDWEAVQMMMNLAAQICRCDCFKDC